MYIQWFLLGPHHTYERDMFALWYLSFLVQRRRRRRLSPLSPLRERSSVSSQSLCRGDRKTHTHGVYCQRVRTSEEAGTVCLAEILFVWQGPRQLLQVQCVEVSYVHHRQHRAKSASPVRSKCPP